MIARRQIKASIRPSTRSQSQVQRQEMRIRQKEVPDVRYVLSKDGLKTDPEKLWAAQEMKLPQNTKELKTFFGTHSVFCKVYA